MTGARAVRCAVRGCCFAILKRADDETPWWCPEHRPWEPDPQPRPFVLTQLDAIDPDNPTPEGHPTP